MNRFWKWSLAIAAVIAVAGFLTYRNWIEERVSPADPLALQALVSDEQVRVVESQWIVFQPTDMEPTRGLIFYPGGECDERGYAEPLRAIAAEGYLVVLTPMPFYLAVLDIDAASDVVNAFPGIERWAIGGHSLGGAMAARYVFNEPGTMQGLLLWDAYPPETDDLSDRDIDVALIHRADPAGRMPDYYEPYMPLLPPAAQFYPIPGGSHINFGRFLPARRFEQAPAATLQIDTQHRLIADASASFLGSL